MTRNTELFDKIADAIEAKPESYQQDLVFNECGTAFCVAGHALRLTGEEPQPYQGSAVLYLHIGWWTRAAKSLGLTEEESDLLFDEEWRPPADETVPQALRRIGRGGEI